MLHRRRRVEPATALRRFVVVMTAAGAAFTFATTTISIAAEPLASSASAVNFNRDIRPILSDHCFQCHGPDEKQRQAELRLDTQDGLSREVDGVAIIDRQQPERSALLQRILSSDPDQQMPPADSGLALSSEQIQLLKRWVESGARWQQHWSLVTPVRPELPTVNDAAPVRNPIDRFVLARLEREGLTFSPEADPATLLRRVHLDLTGLPPDVPTIEAFLKDPSPQAYEAIVDRLLASPEHAERLAIRWLEAARYADTSGYQSDGPRDMWRWRDWVLEAFLANKPFDEFTIEQLAGDLLPDPTLDERIATGFNRNHRGNAEGGVVPEEFQVEYVVDRVDTTFAVWQGVTIGCARCHSHKYDPFSQREYYQLFSYFNNIPEYGRAIKEGNSKPFIAAPTREQQQTLQTLHQRRTTARDRMAEIDQRLPELIAAWRESHSAVKPDDWTDTNSLVVQLELDGSLANTATAVDGPARRSATTVPEANEQEQQLQQYAPRFETEVDVTSSQPVGEFVDGRVRKALKLDGSVTVDVGYIGTLGYFEKFTLSAWIHQDQRRAGTILSRMEDLPQDAGYSFDVTADGHLQLNLVKRWLDDCVRVETTEPVPVGKWVHVCATYDGSRAASGIQFYVDGRPVPLKANFDFINQTFAVDKPLRLGRGQALFHGAIDDVRIYRRHMNATEVLAIAEAASIAELLTGEAHSSTALRAISPESDSSANASIPEKLRRWFLEVAGPDDVRAAWRELVEIERETASFEESLPTVMVMQETFPRETHILTRGQYDHPGERVEPGVPACLPSLPQDVPQNRLGLARWLVRGDNPLTARVTINRYWRDLFGIGLVKTTEDFGVQGERPSHPELLDWLAVEFVDSGWNLRHMLKLLVMSHTYRQSSFASEELVASDPENRLLARGGAFRLPAEVVRDQALFASGLLTSRFGGPSVRPYQPEGLWQEIATDTLYDQSHGEDLYRRSLYTYWKRTVTPPFMANFDAPGREMCEVRVIRTNTPLQALNLMNDVTFVEAARVLAQRLLSDTSPVDDHTRLRQAFLRVVSRPPSDAEQRLLLAGLNRYRQRFATEADAATKLITTGEYPAAADVQPTELAAWTTICSTLMNLHEAVSRQ